MNEKITDVIIHTSDTLTGYQFNELARNVYLGEGIVFDVLREGHPLFISVQE